ncbi:MAG TPA: FtsX-like permease family protein [Patescibacteria group bacterium]|nr:FtsX-like permease family protein [Patescibacteria group bacterium]
MIMLKIAFRNIFRQKRRSTLTALSMFGGFVLAAFFIGFSEGTYNDIINKFTRSQTGHIQVHRKGYLAHPSLYKTIDLPERAAKILGQMDKVDSWAPRLYSAGLASLGDKSTGVRIIGIDPEKEVRTTKFAEKVIAGSMFAANDAHAVMIGKGLARLLHGAVGQDAVIVSQAADGSIANDRYKIVGILESGDEIGDRSSFYLPLAAAQELLVLEGRIHEIAVTARTLHDVAPLDKILEKKLAAVDARLSVEPWQEFARSFYIAMQADKAGMWISLLIIVLVVAVGVLNTVLMSVLERRREYGLLKAVGTKPDQIIKMVLLEVNILGVICIVLGSLVGLLLNYIFSIHGISMPEPMTYGGIQFQHMFTEINVMSFTIPAVTVFLSATLVGFFPALKAAHTDPARSMRTH